MNIDINGNIEKRKRELQYQIHLLNYEIHLLNLELEKIDDAFLFIEVPLDYSDWMEDILIEEKNFD